MKKAQRPQPGSSTPSPGERFCCAWSGGKDSCLTLLRARAAGARPQSLLTLLTEDGRRSRSHGLRREVLEAQAEALGIPLCVASTSWAAYRESFVGLLREAARSGATSVVCGDIDIEAHGRWEVDAAAAAGLRAHLPLWKASRRALLTEWWRLGFEARVVVVRAGLLGQGDLGRRLDPVFARELEARGLDPCGENGEFHTLAIAGPLFRRGLSLRFGSSVRRGDCWCLDIELESAESSGCDLGDV